MKWAAEQKNTSFTTKGDLSPGRLSYLIQNWFKFARHGSSTGIMSKDVKYDISWHQYDQ